MLGFFGLDYRITMGSVAVISAMAIAGPVCAQTRNFDIRAQSAAQSRPIFAKQVGIQILANGNGVRAKWTDAVRGSMSVDKAPRKHLTGTEENGATLIWPGSYGDRALVDDGEGAMIFAAAEPGYAIVFLASMLHGARGSRSPGVRRGIIVSYGLGWPKSYENQYPTYPPPIAGCFPRARSELVGDVQRHPNFGNFERQCPSVLFDCEPDILLAVVDALRPAQAAMLVGHVTAQPRARENCARDRGGRQP